MTCVNCGQPLRRLLGALIHDRDDVLVATLPVCYPDQPGSTIAQEG